MRTNICIRTQVALETNTTFQTETKDKCIIKLLTVHRWKFSPKY